MKSDRRVTTLLVLLAAGCASTPDVAHEGVLVPLAPQAQPIEQLLKNLRSSVPGTRASAAWQLAAVVGPDRTVTEALEVAFTDPDERVREAAAWARGHSATAGSLYDEAPRPVRISRPTYPQAAFDAKIEGTVEIEILISEAGKVVHAEVRRSIPALDRAALECVKGWSFEPARRAGKPVPTMATAPVTFRIY